MSNPRRMTRQRSLILAELAAVRIHPTADELYALVRRSQPRISLGTVYRNLQVLAAEGRVRVLAGPGGRKRYDADLSEHCHACCLGCGQVIDLKSALGNEFPCSPAAPEGFHLVGYRVEYVGLCAECEARGSDIPITGELELEYRLFERTQSAQESV
ncbi:transcriptional repressor [bacterium]|nr:transcriptional repressor [bacterium]